MQMFTFICKINEKVTVPNLLKKKLYSSTVFHVSFQHHVALIKDLIRRAS